MSQSELGVRCTVKISFNLGNLRLHAHCWRRLFLHCPLKWVGGFYIKFRVHLRRNCAGYRGWTKYMMTFSIANRKPHSNSFPCFTTSMAFTQTLNAIFILAFWLVLTYALLEDMCVDHVINNLLNSVSFLYLTIKLWARGFYRVIVDESAVQVNYHTWKSRANNPIVLV